MHDCDDCEQALAEMLAMGFIVHLYTSERGVVARADTDESPKRSFYGVSSGVDLNVGSAVKTLLERCRIHVRP